MLPELVGTRGCVLRNCTVHTKAFQGPRSGLGGQDRRNVAEDPDADDRIVARERPEQAQLGKIRCTATLGLLVRVQHPRFFASVRSLRL